jgi:hypothetical protein
MTAHRTVLLEAHDGTRWRSLSELPTAEDACINQTLLWENPLLSPKPDSPKAFPPLPDDCSEGAKLRLKGVASWIATCLTLPQFTAGVENVAAHCTDYNPRAMAEMKGAIAMAEVLSGGNIPVRFIIFLDH